MENGFSDMGEYHDPQLRLERTDLAQQQFDKSCPDIAGLDESPYSKQAKQIIKLSHHLIQSIIQELPEAYGTTGRADNVWHQLSELELQNGLHPMEFNSVFEIFVDNYNDGVE